MSDILRGQTLIWKRGDFFNLTEKVTWVVTAICATLNHKPMLLPAMH